MGSGTPCAGSARFCRIGQHLEIDMGGQVGLARIVQHGDEGMAPDCLKGLSRRRTRMPVIDDQCGTAGTGQSSAQLAGDRGGGRADLEHAPHGGYADTRRDQRFDRTGTAVQHDPETAAVGIDIDKTFGPAMGRLLELADRQGVEELVRDHQQRTVGHRGEAVVPDRLAALKGRGQRFALPHAENGTGFDQMDAQGLPEGRQHRGGSQRVAHQRASARPKLDEVHAVRRAHGRPGMGTPETDQLSEHLADFRRRDEIAGGAETVGGNVVAELRMTQRVAHERSDGERPFYRDPPLQVFRQDGQGSGVPGFRHHHARPRCRLAGSVRPAGGR